ncbi:MAG: hypothetical protein NTV11_19920 [Rhodocyclales bacterium]|nr:hypothetical protein [Rhodocyclales bacterium]
MSVDQWGFVNQDVDYFSVAALELQFETFFGPLSRQDAIMNAAGELAPFGWTEFPRR